VRSHLGDSLAGCIAKAEAFAPREELVISQQANTLLRLALLSFPRPPFTFQSERIPPAGLHHQLLKVPAIPDGALQVGSEFIRHIDRKPPLPLAAI